MRRKCVLLTTAFLFLAFGLCPALSDAALWDTAKQVNLGFDHLEMQWYILDYGIREDGIPFAVARKYYTNAKEKEKTVALLIEKYGYEKSFAGELYSTEYGYEYTADGKQFAEVYVRHCDQFGGELHVTLYDAAVSADAQSSQILPKTFSPVDPKHAVGKALALAREAK